MHGRGHLFYPCKTGKQLRFGNFWVHMWSKNESRRSRSSAPQENTRTFKLLCNLSVRGIDLDAFSASAALPMMRLKLPIYIYIYIYVYIYIYYI